MYHSPFWQNVITLCNYSQQSSINDNNWVGKSEKHVTKQCLCINPSQSLWSAEPITFMLEEKDGECGTRCECLSEFGKLSGFESTWWSDMAVVPCPLEVLTLVRIVTLEAAGTNHELRWNGQSKVHQGHVPTRYLQWRYTISRLLELNMIRENKKQNTLIFSPPMPKNGQDNQKLKQKRIAINDHPQSQDKQ